MAATKTIKTVESGPDGKPVIRVATAKENADHQRTMAMVEEREHRATDVEELSPARKLLRRLKVGTAPRTERLEANGEVFYIRRLDNVGFNRVAALSARNEEGTLDFVFDDDLRGFMFAVIHVCVSSGEDGWIDYFNQREAWDLVGAREDEARKLAGRLFNKALDINPDLLPPKEESEKASEKKDSAS